MVREKPLDKLSHSMGRKLPLSSSSSSLPFLQRTPLSVCATSLPASQQTCEQKLSLPLFLLPFVFLKIAAFTAGIKVLLAAFLRSCQPHRRGGLSCLSVLQLPSPPPPPSSESLGLALICPDLMDPSALKRKGGEKGEKVFCDSS